MRLYSIITKIFIVLCLLVSGNALAASGYISGTIKALDKHNGFCDPDNFFPDCTGAKYLKSDYETAQPIKEAKVSIVIVVNPGGSETVYSIGEGSTSSSGFFRIGWTVPAGLNASLQMMQNLFPNTQITVQLRWKPTHKDNRFSVVTPSGSQYFMWAPINVLYPDTTFSSPQSLGVLTWGSTSSPNDNANLYLAAERMWTHLSVSNRMQTYFTDVKIVSTEVCQPTNSSCFDDSTKSVKIKDFEAIYKLSTIIHEMGHAVDFLASRDQEYRMCGNQLYGLDNSNPHYLITPMWGCAQFAEGFADFMYATALYEKHAVNPTYCLKVLPSGACEQGFNYYDFEHSSYAINNSCSSSLQENRWEMTSARYLWDLYDSVSDYSGETFNHPLWYFIDTIHAFDNGTGNRQKNEHWNSSLTEYDDLDGRSTYDYKYLYDYWNNVDTSTIYTANCTPVGS